MPRFDKKPWMLQWMRAGLLASLLLATAGCKSTMKSTVRTLQTAVTPGSPSRQQLQFSEIELQQKLAGFYVSFVNAAELATEKASSQTDDLKLRQRLIEGRIRAVRSCRQVAFERPPMAAFIDTWSLCIQFREYIGTPAAKDYFGDAQPLLMDAAIKMQGEVEDLGRLFLKTNELAMVRTNLEVFAHTHPFSATRELDLASQEVQSGLPQFGWLLNIPLAPFRAFEGVDQTAAAVHEFNFVAAGFAQTARDLPQELSWQLELLLLQTRQELQATLDEMDRKQTNTQATLQQVRASIDDANRSLQSVQRLANHLALLVILVILAFFVTLLAYRLIAARCLKSKPEAPPKKS